MPLQGRIVRPTLGMMVNSMNSMFTRRAPTS